MADSRGALVMVQWYIGKLTDNQKAKTVIPLNQQHVSQTGRIFHPSQEFASTPKQHTKETQANQRQAENLQNDSTRIDDVAKGDRNPA